MKVRRLFTEEDMARAYNFGYANGFVRKIPLAKHSEVIKLFTEWLDKTYPEGCEAEVRAKENEDA